LKIARLVLPTDRRMWYKFTERVAFIGALKSMLIGPGGWRMAVSRRIRGVEACKLMALVVLVLLGVDASWARGDALENWLPRRSTAAGSPRGLEAGNAGRQPGVIPMNQTRLEKHPAPHGSWTRTAGTYTVTVGESGGPARRTSPSAGCCSRGPTTESKAARSTTSFGPQPM